MNYEVGKWYKSNAGGGRCATGYYYLKVLRLEEKWLCGEGISKDSWHDNHHWSSHETLKQGLELGPLTDLEEIQIYLPKHHPDRILEKIISEDYSYLIKLFKKLNIN